MNCRLPKTKGFVSNDEIWSAVNLLGVIPQYEFWDFVDWVKKAEI